MTRFIEALTRMRRRGTKTISWTVRGTKFEYSILPSEQARNYDGSYAGYPGQQILQLKVTPLDGGIPRYSNWHNVGEWYNVGENND